jgi:hypothetical protein
MSWLSDDPIYSTLLALRKDAIERDMRDLALVYGWSAVERGDILMRERFGPGVVSFFGIASAARKLIAQGPEAAY